MNLLARIEALESRLEESLGGRNGHAGPVHETSEFTALQTRMNAQERRSLLERVRKLESRIHGPSTESVPDKTNSSSSAVARGQTHVPDCSNEIPELRFQIANLATQLSKAEARLTKVRESRRRRRGGWQFWRRKRSL